MGSGGGRLLELSVLFWLELDSGRLSSRFSEVMASTVRKREEKRKTCGFRFEV